MTTEPPEYMATGPPHYGMDAGIVVWAHLWKGGVSPELASEIKRVLLSSPPSDPKQRAELVAAYLWATDKNHPALRSADTIDFGRVIVDLSCESFDFEVFMLDSAPEAVDRRLQAIVRAYASRVTFSKTGDAFVRNLVRSRLDPARLAATPDVFASFSEQFPGPIANRMLRPFIDTHPTDLAARLSWDSTDGLLFAVAMLAELLPDGITAAFNHEIVSAPPTAIFVVAGVDYGFGDATGAKVGRELCIGGTSAALWHWATHTDHAAELVTALTAPDTLLPTSAFRTFDLD